MVNNGVERLRQLELENGWLKKTGAERDIKIDVTKEAAVKTW